MKVLIVFNHPAPYKVRLFNALSKEIDLDVIFERKTAKDRPADFYVENKYDFIFLDAAKGQYIYFLPYIEKLLDVGGILIADDIFQGGNISQSRYEIPRRQRTIHSRMRAFLWEICHSDVFETALIPIGDGIAFCHKVKEAKEE